MKRSSFLCVLLGIAFTVHGEGQEAAPAPSLPPLPPGPLLNNAPDFSQWTITVKDAATAKSAKPAASAAPKADDDAKAADGASPAPKAGAGDLRIGVIKTGKIRHQVQARGSQVVADIWSVNEILIDIDPRTKIPQVGASSGSDFDGLGWISAKNYTGIEAVGGRKCIVFKAHLNALFPGTNSENSEVHVQGVAYIDLESRLPVLMQRGDTYVYQFGTAPQAALVPPPLVMQAMGAVQEGMKRVTARPGQEPP